MNDVYFPTVFGIGLDKQMPYQPEEQNPVMFMTRNDCGQFAFRKSHNQTLSSQ